MGFLGTRAIDNPKDPNSKYYVDKGNLGGDPGRYFRLLESWIIKLDWSSENYKNF